MLAAHEIGGFKVGVGFALQKCRICLATQDTIQTKVQNLNVTVTFDMTLNTKVHLVFEIHQVMTIIVLYWMGLILELTQLLMVSTVKVL